MAVAADIVVEGLVVDIVVLVAEEEDSAVVAEMLVLQVLVVAIRCLCYGYPCLQVHILHSLLLLL